ncbi:2-keto-4-pentenoate hydratase/2-oxohepta-3-ene-1,7-dioic acid hydratase (catechol pathway) [Lentibacillus halodurans]|uniref:2-keto-4-pentenoate hydratase/2-oxohepta-3-ene-1,7-dioic acid hydratase (Catechol pathway) n=1 Tax=Lentibacillus halodurans TaxID=237679 RepID=A0A1I0WP89_9BACI|nr:fumarylacetoacetate hydrolase family protein [Lentibacillus halodurans]SFA90572.1 2-keto-4-pentenoate hydratase/2-oxohepta-3-ene-1,7-dioic acid hydratase (catechol pathway) [Lentibacillus halodurans]
MKLLSYKIKGSPGPLRMGFMLGEKIVDLQETWRKLQQAADNIDSANAAETLFPADPTQFFAAGDRVIEQAQDVLAFAKANDVEDISFQRGEVYLGPPIPSPSKIICVGKNYAAHAAEMHSNVPEYPVLFAKFANALIGPEALIEKSEKAKNLDYEAELTAVIGKEASHVKREKALDYIAGYTIGNDISARDLQKRTPQWLQGKTLDRTTPIGPWVVTADEMGDPGHLAIRSTVNGEERQSATTEQLIFTIPFLIEFISELITLNPGDIIMTGTPEGVGMGMKPPQYLKDGDITALEIENIGRLENRVKAV